MQEQLITCPHCHKKFPISEAMKHEIEEKVKSDYQEQLSKIEENHSKELKKAKTDAAKEAEIKAKKEIQVEVDDLKNQVKEFEDKSELFRKKELNFLKQERDIKDREANLETEKQKFINSKTLELEVSIAEKVEERFKGIISEKDLERERLSKLVEELQKKLNQGSMEQQGEAFEQELENMLRTIFPLDEFEPVPKGKRGADIIQKVKTENGKHCGTIIWEAKNTANWSENWISKLKDDQRQIDGETVGIIVSRVLPKNIKRFGYYEGIWVSDSLSIIGLATLIRTKFQELYQSKAAIAGRSSISDLIYNYVTGSDFRKRIEATGEALMDMKSDIDKERVAMEKNWSKREKQVYRVIHNMAGVYGDLSGLGANLQKVEILELDSGDGNLQLE